MNDALASFSNGEGFSVDQAGDAWFDLPCNTQPQWETPGNRDDLRILLGITYDEDLNVPQHLDFP